MSIRITPPIKARPMPSLGRWAILALGFRPFFLLAGLSAMILLGPWLAVLGGALQATGGYFNILIWHGHEMLFGYGAAVIAGFLLTATQNWTGLSTPRGLPLAGLAALWLAGRVVVALPSGWLPSGLIAAIDLAFLPLIAVVVGRLIWVRRQRHNYQFVGILIGLSAANLLIHLAALGVLAVDARIGLGAALYGVVLLLIVLGGRVIPFFTEHSVPGVVTRKWWWSEWLAPLATAALAVIVAVRPTGPLPALLAALACAANAVRLWGWQPWRTRHAPMLWILHLGYGWLVLGLGLSAAAMWLPVFNLSAVHALTVGALGGLTLGMMARVALGHTGRPIQAAPITVIAFVLIHSAAVVRVVLPALPPAHYLVLLWVAGLLWSLAFALFLLHYTPILLHSRIDGQEG